MIVRSTEGPAVAAGLLDFLRDKLDAPFLRYREAPTQIPNGWETYTYRFQLYADRDLPHRFEQPLILRLYANSYGLETVRHDYAVQSHMVALKYPVPEPLFLEEDCGLFDGPFMIMQRALGEMMLDCMWSRTWRIIRDPVLLARMHAQLHALPADNFPAPEGSFLNRKLYEVRERIDKYDMGGLLPGWEWLCMHRPPPPPVPSILHLDYHPMNVIFDGAQHTVLDWSESDVGDSHADVATTLVLLETAPVDLPRWWQALLHWPGRFLLHRWYWKTYQRIRPLDPEKLSYYKALTVLRRLSRFGLWLRAGPAITGSKPTSLRYWSPRQTEALERSFLRHTGVKVRLEC